ncbi:MAG: sigma-54-dependent Fis family transcriptional regulator [Deltaproteobacteria bacterium]|nr:sigma-54-dependent Fis family transcriptional regulator [Deltaproteobacteria bacterium]MBI2533221.1 sigma-54-dependent Fis family transcriptional regulator [Deltaproteobacteria bacterium]MBI3063498.1 sigma-54-dependent Fis family transcriptional regulator [Deltaproteobacteria bacterium]
MLSSQSGSILIVDDERHLRETLREIFEEASYQVWEAGDGQTAIEQLQSGSASPDVVFLDLKMPRLDGLATLRMLHDSASWRTIPVVIITSFGTSDNTIEAMKLGAFDYITKPFNEEEVIRAARRAVEVARLGRELDSLRDQVSRSRLGAEGELIGQSAAIREVFKLIGKTAPADATVLITGESGTGKELVARAIHRHSLRADGPFVAVNCPAIPESLLESEMFGYERGAFTGAVRDQMGRFESAAGGSVFLDEIGDLPVGTQAKLLRTLQDHVVERLGGRSIPVDFRLIAATNRSLEQLVAEGCFREDLYYRLNVVRIHLPPLRERRADILPLAEGFLWRHGQERSDAPRGFTEEATRLLLAYDYPGNVRELENIVQRALVLARGALITAADFPIPLAGETEPGISQFRGAELLTRPLGEAVQSLEREMIRRALARCQGNKAEAARLLGINRQLLYTKLKELGIE